MYIYIQESIAKIEEKEQPESLSILKQCVINDLSFKEDLSIAINIVNEQDNITTYE